MKPSDLPPIRCNLIIQVGDENQESTAIVNLDVASTVLHLRSAEFNSDDEFIEFLESWEDEPSSWSSAGSLVFEALEPRMDPDDYKIVDSVNELRRVGVDIGHFWEVVDDDLEVFADRFREQVGANQSAGALLKNNPDPNSPQAKGPSL